MALHIGTITAAPLSRTAHTHISQRLESKLFRDQQRETCESDKNEPNETKARNWVITRQSLAGGGGLHPCLREPDLLDSHATNECTLLSKVGSVCGCVRNDEGGTSTQERIQHPNSSEMLVFHFSTPAARMSAFTVRSEEWCNLAVKKVSASFVLGRLTLTLQKMRLNESLGL